MKLAKKVGKGQVAVGEESWRRKLAKGRWQLAKKVGKGQVAKYGEHVSNKVIICVLDYIFLDFGSYDLTFDQFLQFSYGVQNRCPGKNNYTLFQNLRKFGFRYFPV